MKHWAAMTLLVGAASASPAQDRADSLASRRPQFYLAAATARAPVDVARSPSLLRRVALDFTSTRLADALAELSRRSGMAIVFSSDVVSSEKRIDLRASSISVAAALTELLLDCNVDVVMHGDGSAALVPRRVESASMFGAIRGVIRDAATGTPMPAVSVAIDGMPSGATTDDAGAFAIPRVGAGTHVIAARRVGYEPTQHSLVVVGGRDVSTTLELTAVAASLDAQVSTATGQQRRVQLGNTVATISVAPRVATAPVKNVGDLLTAQMTSVLVSGANLTGGTSRVRIRGQNSMSLNNDPIYIIDGVRMTSVVGGAGTGGINGAGSTVPSRVNDINPEQIETVEVVKGPSAATLYGTDAANGVIVITTKRGKPGRAAWSVRAEQGRLEDRNDYPATYNLLGKSPGSPAPRTCFTYQIADGSCLLDSAVSLNLFKMPELTTLKPGSRQLIGGQVSGGSDAVRYMISGDVNHEIGPVGIPDAFADQLEARGAALRPNVRRPNALSQHSARLNVNAALTPRIDIAASSGLTSLEVRFPQQGNTSTASYTEYAQWGPGYNDGSVDRYGQPLLGYVNANPGSIFQIVSRQNARRLIGGLNANWRAMDWLHARADVGYDFTNQIDFYLQRPGEGLGGSEAAEARTTHLTLTNNLATTATWRATYSALFRTTFGAQFVSRTSTTSSIKGVGLASGVESPSQATTVTATAFNNPSKTLGLFAEEQLAWRDRLFFTAAIRSDRNSAFGADFGHAYYPKASMSWIASDESFFPRVPGLDQLRLRTSYGASGVQPGATASLRLYNVVPVTTQGVTTTGLAQLQPGNPALRPETSAEIEGGFDARFFAGRVNTEITLYRKNTRDALVTQPVAPSAGVGSFLANLGGVQNAGIEYLIQAQPIDRRSLGLDLSFSASHNQNRITSLGGIVRTPTSSNQVGYPINAYHLRSLTWDDRDANGLLALSEVTLSGATDVRFVGRALPPTQMAVTGALEVVNRKLRISTLVDRKAGGVALNGELSLPCLLQVFSCMDQKRLDTPMWRQARGVAALRYAYSGSYVESTDYTRLREIAMSLDLTDRLAKRIGARSLQITAAARNIARWTTWTGTDPEAFESSGSDVPVFVGGTSAPPMYFMLRLNLGY